MNYLLWAASLVGLINTAVIFGTDMFFLTVGRSALRLASEASATEVMGFFHLFGDKRMPVWGVLAVLSNLLLVLLGGHAQKFAYVTSLAVLVLFVVAYNRLSKPINQAQTDAAKTGRTLQNARALQMSWDRTLTIRVPLLSISMLAQIFTLSGRF